jgi:hypothetical protein
MWANCVSTIGKLSVPRLMHYGAYETQFLKRMRARYPEVRSASLLDELMKSAQNLVSIIYPHVYFICRPESASESNYPTVNADAIKREFPQRFGEVDFVLPEFRAINEAAYWDYQRSKVYVRSNSWRRRLKRKTSSRQSMRNVPVSKLFVMNEERPATCPRCNSRLIYSIGRTTQRVYDLKLSPTGVKRWVVKYSHRRFKKRQAPSK